MDRALEEAGIDRKQVYVTNAVKHFKWESRGKRRIHKKTNSREIAACRPWLEAEIRLVRPDLVVAMGATAAQTIFGPSFRVTRDREKFYRRNWRRKLARRFIHRLFCGNRMTNLASASTETSLPIFARL